MAACGHAWAGYAPLRARGLTLIEVMVTLVLVAVLFGAIVLNVFGWGESGRLDEGARRFETLVLMARAEAANLGRQVRLEFEPDEDGWVNTTVLWEPDPVAAPQTFVEYACGWASHAPNGLVSVASSMRTGPSAYRLLESQEMNEDGSAEPLDSLTFYPDGSCDSAVVELMSTSDRDSRTAVITIDGLTVTVTRELLTPIEFEQYEQQ